MTTVSAIPAVDHDLSFQVITERDEIDTIVDEWDALWLAADAGYALSSASVRRSWDEVCAPLGYRLRVVVGREAGRVVVVWPLAVHRVGPWWVGRQAGSMAAESTAVLVEPGPRAATRVRAAWEAATATRSLDLLALPFLAHGSPLERLAAGHARSRDDGAGVSPRLVLGGETGWEAYEATLGAKHRRRNRAATRKLEALGEVTVEVREAGDPGAAELVGWAMDQKQVWSARTGKAGSWLRDEGYRRFLCDLVTVPDPAQRALVLSAHLDGRPVAVRVGVVGAHHLDLVIGSFDQSLTHASPGTTLDTACVRWAVERGLDVELGVGSEGYKMFFARGNVTETRSWTVAVTRWGAVGLAAQQLAGRLRDALAARRS